MVCRHISKRTISLGLYKVEGQTIHQKIAYIFPIHTNSQADKSYNKQDIHVEKIYLKNEDFEILDTFTQRLINVFGY